MIEKPVSGRYAAISQRLRAIRAYYDLPSKEFAALADVPPKSYSQWESGDFRISIEGATKLGARFGTTLDFIYLGRIDTLPTNLAKAVASSPLLKATSKSSETPD